MPKAHMTFRQLDEHMHSLISKSQVPSPNQSIEGLKKLLKQSSLDQPEIAVDAVNSKPFFDLIKKNNPDVLKLNFSHSFSSEHPEVKVYIELATWLKKAVSLPNDNSLDEITAIYRHHRRLSFEEIKNKISPYIQDINSAQDYSELMGHWAEGEQVDMLRLTRDILIRIINTREDLDLITSSLTQCASRELFSFLKPEKLASIYRADNEENEESVQINHPVNKLTLKPAPRSGGGSPKSSLQFFMPAAKAEARRCSVGAYEGLVTISELPAASGRSSA